MKLRSILVLAGAAALAAPGAARAGTGAAQAAISHVTITLTDLNPNDGITPAITLLPLPGPGGLNGEVDLHYDAGAGEQVVSEHATGTAPLSVMRSEPILSLGASASGLADPAAWSLSAFANFNADDQYIGPEASAFSPMQDFILTPNTELTISAVSHLTGSVTSGGEMNYVEGDVSIVLNVPDAVGAHYIFSDPVALYLSDDRPAPPYDRTSTVSLSYSNAGALSLNGSFMLNALVLADHVPGVMPVPEPASLAMYAAGLPLLLALRRRGRLTGEKS